MLWHKAIGAGGVGGGGGWDISTATYLQSKSVTTQDTTPVDVFFKSDGTKMYVLGGDNDSVYEYSISTAWDVSTASYSSTFSVNAQEAAPQGLFFKPDGAKMYVCGSTGDEVNEYDLSTAWDISTASYLQNKSINAQDSSPRVVFFKPDGTKMYVSGATNDSVYEYDLSTAWDVTTASYSQSKSVTTQDSTPHGLFFKPDGTKMYVLGLTNDSVFEYDLSTAWDISTASYLQTFSVNTQDSSPRGVFFGLNGTKMYVCGTTTESILEYDL